LQASHRVRHGWCRHFVDVVGLTVLFGTELD
jgi:hypothetical protein